MKYPSLGIIGCENLAGMYGVNEGIIDGKGVGVRHLFYGAFDRDLIHSAITMIKDENQIYYGNRVENRAGHPIHHKPVESYVKEGYKFHDTFKYDTLEKTDIAYGYGNASLGFDCSITNTSDMVKTLEVYAYVILRPQNILEVSYDNSKITVDGSHPLVIHSKDCELYRVLDEGPTGFIYRGTSSVLYDEVHNQVLSSKNDHNIAVMLGKKIVLNPGESTSYHWEMDFDGSSGDKDYWQNYFTKGHPIKDEQLKNNLVAIKSAMLKGFVPADLTGHYYSDGLPSYYARDAMMVARAFILSGHYEDAKAIINYLKKRSRKESGEFYQRYNGLGIPSEGANNNVHHQLDSIGYYMRNVRDYYRKTGTCLLSEDEILDLMKVLELSEKKNGMIGPEGGVNEGVFGPAFITSSNMFIYGGIQSAIELLDEHPYCEVLHELSIEILEGVESTFIEGEGYQYGYVTYHDDLVKKYDTPQYFGLLYGFKDTENMRTTHKRLLSEASFFTDGIGYSEQAYHHGPWIFNTGACAEYAYLIGDIDTYDEKKKWMSDHGNGYGLMPEAINGDDEDSCYINPLIWACAEYVSTWYINQQET